MAKILIAEDDSEINSLICDFLSGEGFDVISSHDGLDAINALRSYNDISLVILDLMLPYKSGDMVLSDARTFTDVPFIVLSAKSDTRSKIDLIKMGADDYMTKPFDLDELLVRINAVLRRMGKGDIGTAVLSHKNLIMNVSSKTVEVCTKPLTLTAKEFAILELLLRNPNTVFSKSRIFEAVWDEPFYDDSTIKVHMSNLRSKLKKADSDNKYIETVWGMGYRLC